MLVMSVCMYERTYECMHVCTGTGGRTVLGVGMRRLTF